MKHSMLVILAQILLVLTGCSSSELHPAKPMRQWESCTLFEPFEPGGDVPNEHYDPKLVANRKQEQDYIDCGRYKFEIPLEYDQSPDYELQQEFCEAVYTRGGVSKEAYEICITAYGQDDYKGFDMEDSESEETVVTAAELEERRQQGNSAPSGHVLGSSIGTATEYNGVLRRNPGDWCSLMPDHREFRYDDKMNHVQTAQVLACATKSSTPVAEDRKLICDTYRNLFYTDTIGSKVAVMNCGEYEFPGDMIGTCSNNDDCFSRLGIKDAHGPNEVPAGFYVKYFDSGMSDDEIKKRALSDYIDNFQRVIKAREEQLRQCVAQYQDYDLCNKDYGPVIEKLKHHFETRLSHLR